MEIPKMNKNAADLGKTYSNQAAAKIFIGIDTSCYTTSFAAVDENGSLVAEERRLLAVKLGERGLQQSAALFQHIKEGNEVFVKGMAQVQGLAQALAGVGVSVRPRPQGDSYMPVFLAGKNNAAFLAAAFSVPLWETSHQEGHLKAGTATAQMPFCNEFLGVQLSGGTTEILVVSPFSGGFKTEIIGGTLDLHAGQLVDRVGVAMGLNFPCGPALDKLALAATASFPLKPFVKECSFAFSGGETQALRGLADEAGKEQVAKGVFDLIVKSLAKALEKAGETTGLRDILLVGGVSGSAYFQRELALALPNLNLYFAPAEYGKDNALGVALLTREHCLGC